MKERKINLLLLSFFGVFVFIVLAFNYRMIFNSKDYNVSFLDNWYYSGSNSEKGEFTLPKTLEMDEMGYTEFSTVLPNDFHEHTHIAFYTYYRSVYVYADGKLIYEYNEAADRLSFGEASSSSWHFVELNRDDFDSNILTIKTHTPYTDVSNRLTEVVCGDILDIQGWLEHQYGALTCIDGIVFWIGIIFIVVMLLNRLKKRYNRNQAFAGLFLILCSIYMRTGTKSLPIYWMSNYVKDLLLSLSMLLLALPLILYIKSRVSDKPRMAAWCNIVVALNIFTLIILFALHGLEMADLHRIISFGLIWVVVVFLTGAVFSLYFIFRYHSKYPPISLFSLLVIIPVFSIEYAQFFIFDGLLFDTGLLSHVASLAVVAIESASYIVYIKEEKKNVQLVRKENENLRVHMMNTQIKPHFILNTLGAIRTLIKDDADRASDLLYDFSKYIRQNLEEKDYSKPVPFLEELDYINTYLSLEKARFGDVIDLECDIREKNFWVLPLTLQPFVENSVKHGLSKFEKGGLITIKTRDMGSYIMVELKDNGVGFDTAELEHKLETQNSVGMRSAITRLEKEMGANVIIKSSTSQKHSGTTIRIEIPKIQKGR